MSGYPPRPELLGDFVNCLVAATVLNRMRSVAEETGSPGLPPELESKKGRQLGAMGVGDVECRRQNQNDQQGANVPGSARARRCVHF